MDDHYLDALASAALWPHILDEPTREGSRNAVADGWGFTLTARSLAQQHPLPGVAHRPLADSPLAVAIHLAWKRDTPPSAAETLTQQHQ